MPSRTDLPASTDPQHSGPTLLDIQPYQPSTASIVWNAVEQVRATCMRTQGFDYQTLPAGDYEASRQTGLRIDRFDGSIASVYGYHTELIPLDPAVAELDEAYAEAAEANEAASESIPSFRTALEGSDGNGGCQNDAMNAVYGNRTSALEVWSTLFAEAIAEVSADVASSAHLSKLQKDWSGCMAQAGFDYSEVGAPAAEFVSTPEPSANELRVAEADAECREQVNWYEALKDEERRLLAAWLEQNPSALSALQAAEAADLAAALDIIEDR